jgi:hypothetical protein
MSNAIGGVEPPDHLSVRSGFVDGRPPTSLRLCRRGRVCGTSTWRWRMSPKRVRAVGCARTTLSCRGLGCSRLTAMTTTRLASLARPVQPIRTTLAFALCGTGRRTLFGGQFSRLRPKTISKKASHYLAKDLPFGMGAGFKQPIAYSVDRLVDLTDEADPRTSWREKSRPAISLRDRALQ